MFGAFKPSAPLSGGLLWKIPWRLSSTRKLRHRRRLRRVDNVVEVLDSALKRAAPMGTLHTQQSSQTQQQLESSDLANTAEGQRQLATEQTPSHLLSRRHGRGPLQGEYTPSSTSLPAKTPGGEVHLQHPSSKLLREQAAESKTIKLIERWKTEMPTEAEMLPRDKYTMFDRKVRGYRKGVHKLPKWTRVSQRVNPPGF